MLVSTLRVGMPARQLIRTTKTVIALECFADDDRRMC
jgi:hypothetical protein